MGPKNFSNWGGGDDVPVDMPNVRSSVGKDRSPERAADHRWLEWSVHPPHNDAMLIIRRGFRTRRHTWDWDNPNEYFDLNRELSLIPSPVSGTPESQTDDDDLANEADVLHEVD